MANLSTKIKLYLGRKFSVEEVLLQNDNDGNGAYIKEWNVSDEKAEPTVEQLNALESEGNDLEEANQIIANRRKEYPSIEECVHAILDDDLENLQILRTAVKEKYPK